MIKAKWTNADALDLQPTCNQVATDCISRQDAIMHFVKASENYECGMFSLAEVTHELWKIASAQPDKDLIHLQKEQAYMNGYEDGRKSRKGKWIHEGLEASYARCSSCGWRDYTEDYSNYCPHCGAKMEVENDKLK